jgi:Na+-driven multidrug efflux pump
MIERAREVTLKGALIAAAFTGSIGILLTLFPDLWLRLFSQDSAVLVVGEQYFHRVGPIYVCFGLGMICYSAAQGLGRATLPLYIALTRLLIVAPTAIWAGHHWGLGGVFLAMGGGYAFFGISLSTAMFWLYRSLAR